MAAIPVVYAVGTEMVHLASGETVRVQKGTHWPAEDRVVAARPELFSTDTRWGMQYTSEPDGYGDPIDRASSDGPPAETTTAAPGERRGARRA